MSIFVSFYTTLWLHTFFSACQMFLYQVASTDTFLKPQLQFNYVVKSTWSSRLEVGLLVNNLLLETKPITETETSIATAP